jgi:pseudouridine-5'-phosphate glycosidase
MRGLAVELHPEVREALDARGPVVALETSVLAQGLPYPHNLEAARSCEEAVRAAGAVPAAVAVLEGRLHVGLSVEETRALAEQGGSAWKLGERDLAVALAQGATGATTVSATCAVAAALGIRVFATGGIGGVHRGVEAHGDVSQDLQALARHPVGVVCAGAKSILDLPRTLEHLEMLGVPVMGVGTRDFPAFYSRSSGLQLEHQVVDAQGAAKLLQARVDKLGQGGVVFALPPPEATALSRDEVERALVLAQAEAAKQGVTGKALTPFLLKALGTHTGGRTLNANLALLANNASFAGHLASAYVRVRAG